ncbi:MAG TPA: MgtC/SapB family protein [Candidatus Limnocylindrales bacterium]|nr:MgtC/SapB family protein [Candidatus Limnocylindrales bacterium]
MMTITHWEISIRLFLAVFLGGLVGFERERLNRPAGLRTHILVCAGAALIMMVSAYGFVDHAAAGIISDPGRIAAQVVTGVGFLGAGTILQHRGSVRGLTTAASIWVVSGIGLAIGIGFYAGAVVTTFFVLLSLIFVRRAEKKYFLNRRLKKLVITAVDQPGLLGKLGNVLGDLLINIRRSEIGDPEQLSDDLTELIEIEFLLQVPYDLDLKHLFSRLFCLPGVVGISWQDKEIKAGAYPPGL